MNTQWIRTQRTLRIVGALAVLVCCNLVSASVLDSDNFDDNNDSGWTRFDPFAGFGAPATWTLVGGTYQIDAPVSPNPTMLGPSRAGSIRSGNSYADARIVVDIVDWDVSHDQAFGLLARLTSVGLGTTDGYAMTYSTGSQEITITRIDDEAAINLAETAVTFVSGFDYRLEFELVGSQLTGRAFELSNLSTPIAVVGWNDATYANGLPGVLVFDNTNRTVNSLGAWAIFDNFGVSTVPEPSFAAGLAVVMPALVRRRRGSRLNQ